MKEPEELESMRKIDEVRRFSNKELRLTKESMRVLPKSSEYCGPIKKKSYSYVSGIIGIAYNPFLSEDIRDCFFDYEQALMLSFCRELLRLRALPILISNWDWSWRKVGTGGGNEHQTQ